MDYDVFISYESEDEESFVAPLSGLLAKFGAKVWFAPTILKVGDSLSRSIDLGLAKARFGVVVLSKTYVAKPWPEYELRGLTSKAIGSDKVILPIWHGISRDEVLNFSPPLADAFALDTSKLALPQIALRIIEVVRPDIFNNLTRLAAWERVKAKGVPSRLNIDDVDFGPVVHQTLPETFLIRAKLIHHTFADVLKSSLKDTIDDFKRDLYPLEEILVWERMAAAYLDLTNGKKYGLAKKKDILRALLGYSMDMIEDTSPLRHLTSEEIIRIGDAYRNVVPRLD